MNFIKKEINWGGRVLSLETGRLARQANGAILAKYGDSTVLAAVCVNLDVEVEADFVPLSVHYQEKYYAAGKIPGGFFKREGKATEKEMLTSRLIDRPLRPTISKDFKHEIQVVCTVLSYDTEVNTDILAIIASSAALQVSGVPSSSVIAACRVYYSDGKFSIINDNNDSDLDLAIAGSDRGILMVESRVSELSEEQMIEGIQFGYDNFQPVIDLIKDLKKEVGTEEIIPAKKEIDAQLIAKVKSLSESKISSAYDIFDRKERRKKLAKILSSVTAEFSEDEKKVIAKEIENIKYETMRSKILDTKVRIDGRGLEDIRQITIETDVLPKVHGSAIFTRGDTQCLSVITLGNSNDEQIIDSLEQEYRERFMLQYNFPSYSVGEVGRMGPPGRREVGHGKLAWRAFNTVMPKTENDFPYTIRVVAEILESSGSSSMATVCSSSLAFMDAGVPIKSHVAGIAMGLVVSDSNHVILSDISGDEDHFGDMDFKVAGTDRGITALQMDIKTDSISFEIMKEALAQAKKGRAFILEKMNSAIESYNLDLKSSVPQIKTIAIPKDKVHSVIGSGGKVIKSICEENDVKIDISDDNIARIFSSNQEGIDAAYNRIREIICVPELGKIYSGVVARVKPAGAVIQFGKNDGWLHISEISEKRISNINNILKEGKKLQVKVTEIEDSGRVNLTIKGISQNPVKEGYDRQ